MWAAGNRRCNPTALLARIPVLGSGRSVVWLARLFRVQEVVSSNLTAPTIPIHHRSAAECSFSINFASAAGNSYKPKSSLEIQAMAWQWIGCGSIAIHWQR